MKKEYIKPTCRFHKLKCCDMIAQTGTKSLRIISNESDAKVEAEEWSD
jgi:hypothetical protein